MPQDAYDSTARTVTTYEFLFALNRRMPQDTPTKTVEVTQGFLFALNRRMPQDSKTPTIPTLTEDGFYSP